MVCGLDGRVQLSIDEVWCVCGLDGRVQLSIDEVVAEVNEKHMPAWSDACQHDAVTNTPLTPYIEKVRTDRLSSLLSLHTPTALCPELPR